MSQGAKAPEPMKVDVVGDILTITIDLRANLGPSGSGKSTVVATTRGNVTLADGVKLGLNCYRPI
jgi:ABC-type uncharacterized transport system YnjBCD ATPase subunit